MRSIARVLPVPTDIHKRLSAIRVRSPQIFSDASNQDIRSEVVCVARQEKLLDQADAVGARVWQFTTYLLDSMGEEVPEKHFFIARDEQELDALVAAMEVMIV